MPSAPEGSALTSVGSTWGHCSLGTLPPSGIEVGSVFPVWCHSLFHRVTLSSISQGLGGV